MKKIVLAFSGGLDTTFCIPFLQEKDYEVIAVTVDTGGFDQKELNLIKQKAKSLGVKHYLIDGKEDLYQKTISYIIKGNILRGGVYPLLVGPDRVIQASKVIEIAKKEKAKAIAHGSTGAGNDQVRFDTYIRTLAPKLEIIAPIRELSLSRESEIAYLEKYGIVVDAKKHEYSINKGLLGTTIGGKETLTSWESVPDKAYPTVKALEETPKKLEVLSLTFKKGLPVAIDNKKLSGIELMNYLNVLGAKHGVGKGVHLGNTILGIKGRVAFEAAAAILLIQAHKELEKLVLTKWQSFWKDHLSNVYGDLLHEAQYFDPIMRDIEAFIDSSQKFVSGKVKIKLHKGTCSVLGVESPYSLMNTKVASYGEENHFWNGSEASGFSKIFGMQSMLAYQIQNNKDKS